jgi:MerR family transcriptional regulator, redox-sensitive transcriptional activator SoxR
MTSLLFGVNVGSSYRGCSSQLDVKYVTQISEVLSIGEVARESGKAASAIRYYEEIGLLPPPARVNGRRRYDWSAVQRLCVIEYAQQAGFTLGEIRELFFGFAVGTHPTERWKALAQRKLQELEEQSRRIQAAQDVLREGIRCGCLTMEQCTVWLSGLEQSPPVR